MTASSSAQEQIRSRAWLLHVEFAVVGRLQIANNQTNQIFQEYVQQRFDSRTSCFEQHMTGLILLSFSLLTPLFSLCDKELCLCLPYFITHINYARVQLRKHFTMLRVSPHAGPVYNAAPTVQTQGSNPWTTTPCLFCFFVTVLLEELTLY